MICIEKDACVLVEQDLNSDGRAERILFAFNDERYIVYGIDPAGKEWKEITMNSLPAVITKENYSWLRRMENWGRSLKCGAILRWMAKDWI